MYTIKYIKLAPTFKYMYRKVSVKVNSKIQLNGHDQSGVVMCYAYILFFAYLYILIVLQYLFIV